jgi:hypothetical protein
VISLTCLVHPSSSDQPAVWLSPPDPSINLNIACDTHHTGTAVWFTESNTFRRWKELGSVIWICGKRMFPHSAYSQLVIDFQHRSGVWQKHSNVCNPNRIAWVRAGVLMFYLSLAPQLSKISNSPPPRGQPTWRTTSSISRTQENKMPLAFSPPSSYSSVVNLFRSARYFMNYSQNIKVVPCSPVKAPLNNASKKY